MTHTVSQVLIQNHFWPIEPEKEEGPGVPTGDQLWGLLPEQSQYVGTG